MLLVLIIVNLLSFLLCGIDKYLAIQNKRRIPEQMLFFSRRMFWIPFSNVPFSS